MTPARIKELRALVEAGTTYAPLPWSGGGHSPETWIVAENQKIGGPRHVLEVRGWGYLTGHGHGGLGLDGDPAFQNQKDVRKLTVAAVNELGPLLDEVERLEHHRALLGQALGEVLVHVGMIRKDAQMTGPELLMAAETFCGGPPALEGGQ